MQHVFKPCARLDVIIDKIKTTLGIKDNNEYIEYEENEENNELNNDEV